MIRLLAMLTSIVLLLLSNSSIADYVKVANDGSSLPISSKLGSDVDAWSCTYDSKAHLMCEIKTNDLGLRDKHWSYSWFNSNPKLNGGFAGSSNDGVCFDKTNCDTEKYIQQVNKIGLCGAHNWRLPSIDEIKSLINPAYNSSINPYYFPDQSIPKTTVFGYWSSTNALSPDPTPLKAEYVLFEKASVNEDFKNKLHRVTLVRDAENFVPAASPEALLEEFDNKLIVGTGHGIVFDKTLTGRGGRFSRVSESSIQYPISEGLPKSGTLEFRLNIKSGYRYSNFQLNANEPCALILSTDINGNIEDPWHSAVKFYACKNGDIALNLNTVQTQEAAVQSINAKATKFRFNQWHVLSISFGKKGQSIALDGDVVAEALQNSQELNTGNTTTVDALSLGESHSSVWQNHQYAAGFEGIIDTFRASRAQKDWTLGIDHPKLQALLASGSFRKPNRTSAQAVAVLVNDYVQRHFFGKQTDQNWFQFFAKKGLRYSIEIPNDSVGDSLNPGIEILDTKENILVNLINNRGAGEGELFQWTAPQSGLYRVRVTNQPPFKRDSNTDDGYEFQVYLTDEPQQGIIKGQALSSCSNSGVYQAEISAWLSEFVTDSTLTHSTGEFGLPLNPNDYDIKSFATNYLDLSQAISVSQVDVTPVVLVLSPANSCSDSSTAQLDPVILEQQAGAVYDATDGSLVIRDIVADETVLYVELHDMGGYRFQVDRTIEIPQTIHSEPATYDAGNHSANLPNVFIADKLYNIQLKHDDNWVFTVDKIE